MPPLCPPTIKRVFVYIVNLKKRYHDWLHNPSQAFLLPRNTSYLWRSCVKILIRLIFRPFLTGVVFCRVLRLEGEHLQVRLPAAAARRPASGCQEAEGQQREHGEEHQRKGQQLLELLLVPYFCRLADFLSNGNYPKPLVNAGMGSKFSSFGFRVRVGLLLVRFSCSKFTCLQH